MGRFNSACSFADIPVHWGKFVELRFPEDAFKEEDLDAPYCLFVCHLELGHISLDEWLEEVPTVLDLDEDANYPAYYT